MQNVQDKQTLVYENFICLIFLLWLRLSFPAYSLVFKSFCYWNFFSNVRSNGFSPLSTFSLKTYWGRWVGNAGISSPSMYSGLILLLPVLAIFHYMYVVSYKNLFIFLESICKMGLWVSIDLNSTKLNMSFELLS